MAAHAVILQDAYEVNVSDVQSIDASATLRPKGMCYPHTRGARLENGKITTGLYNF